MGDGGFELFRMFFFYHGRLLRRCMKHKDSTCGIGNKNNLGWFGKSCSPFFDGVSINIHFGFNESSLTCRIRAITAVGMAYRSLLVQKFVLPFGISTHQPPSLRNHLHIRQVAFHQLPTHPQPIPSNVFSPIFPSFSHPPWPFRGTAPTGPTPPGVTSRTPGRSSASRASTAAWRPAPSCRRSRRRRRSAA